VSVASVHDGMRVKMMSLFYSLSSDRVRKHAKVDVKYYVRTVREPMHDRLIVKFHNVDFIPTINTIVGGSASTLTATLATATATATVVAIQRSVINELINETRTAHQGRSVFCNTDCLVGVLLIYNDICMNLKCQFHGQCT
jgi:hypothetical protein